MIENKKIKIAYIVPALDAGGAERFILDLIKNLDHDLFSPTLILFSHGGFFVKEARELGIELVILQKKFKFDVVNLVKLYRVIKRIRPHIVHTQLGGDIYGRFVARCLRVPVIISTEQNVQQGESWLIRFLKKWTARFADKIVVISQAVRSDTIQRYGVPESRTELIYNGLEIDKFLVAKRRAQSDKIILGSVGRLSPQKNYSLLLRALADLKDYNWEFRLAGEGELRQALEREVEALGLVGRVKLLGLKKDVKGFLSDLDIFILPSLWEGLGLVLLEAGLAALPVLASRVDGIYEVVKDGQTGILFNSDDQPDLVLKLRLMLDNIAKPEIEALGRSLQADIRERFDIKTIAEQYHNLYLKLLAKK